MTPTTAAVIAPSAPASRVFPRSRSIDGAPRKMNRKLGTKVAHAVTIAPARPAAAAGSDPGSRNAATNPTKTTTRISGPGVVSARLSPTAISLEVSHPNRRTAAWFTYASTAYAPPNVTSAITAKNTASSASTLSVPAASTTSASGINHTASPRTSARSGPRHGRVDPLGHGRPVELVGTGSEGSAREPTDEARPQHDERERHAEQEQREERHRPRAHLGGVGGAPAIAIRSSAAATMPTTAHDRPSKTAATQPTSPCTT